MTLVNQMLPHSPFPYTLFLAISLKAVMMEHFEGAAAQEIELMEALDKEFSCWFFVFF